MDTELILLAPPPGDRRIPLPPGAALVLGCGPEADVVLDASGVSRLHCCVERADDGVRVWNMGANRDTRVNGAPLARETPLADGDVLAVGAARLRLRFSGTDKAGRPGGECGAADALKKQDTTLSDFTPLLTRGAPTPTPGAFLSDEPHEDSTMIWTPPPPESGMTEADAASGVRQTRVHLDAIIRLGDLLYDKVNADEVIQATTEAIFDVTSAENAAMVLAGPPLRVVCSLSRRAGRVAGGTFAISQSVVAETLRQGAALIANNALDDERFLRESILSKNIQCAMCVPIRNGEHVTGAFYVDRRGDGSGAFDGMELVIMSALGRQAGIALERARLVDDLQALFIGSMQTMVKSLEAKDPYTRGHSERVTRYALALADRLAWTPARRDVLELAGLMHDIGKIGIPEAILGKPGKLSDEEFAVIRRHPDIGADILGQMPNLDRMVPVTGIVAAVRHHHEKVDGGGYPDGLVGDAIPPEARLLAVADTYDAIATTRPYRRGDRSHTLRIIRGVAGRQLDTEAVEVFEELVREGLPQRLAEVPTRFAAPLS